MNKLQDLSAPIGRIFLAAIFIMSGLGKITNYAGTQGYMDAMGVPGVMLPLVIILEVLGGIAIVVGFKARFVAFLMAGFSVVSAILFHADFGDQTQLNMFMKNIAIAGGFLLIVAHGAGAYSLDNRQTKISQ
ncbi:DoxX family protein [Marinicella gelatinilytica]|uniref:DoxX family protein n=1 Tax=Marinicella gelatinilytica TaxID=2996017 RepID=UPI002260BF65|nr:DoxX family protein [Marinicella gelatinilytica]MCX7544896.1 DoxX family protein [Marinicella gelatinilytica]